MSAFFELLPGAALRRDVFRFGFASVFSRVVTSADMLVSLDLLPSGAFFRPGAGLRRSIGFLASRFLAVSGLLFFGAWVFDDVSVDTFSVETALS